MQLLASGPATRARSRRNHTNPIPRSPLGTTVGLALAGALIAAGASGQATGASDEPPASSFSAEASAITVDVVVLDAAGHPVTGLGPEDFEVFEDGARQTVVAFEAREPAPPEAAAPGPAPGATNVGAAAEIGRVMALLVDDLGIAPETMTALKPALAAWLRDRALDRDEITIATTSGDRWWSDSAAEGRDDLAATVESLTGKRLDGSSAPGWMSESEAYDIAVRNFNMEKQAPAQERSRPDVVPGTGSALESELQGGTGSINSTLKRVARRYLDERLCDPEYMPPAMCFAMVQSEAMQVLERSRGRIETALRSVRRLSRSLSGLPGRKSILLVSESFIDDRSIDGPYRATVDAAQRANTAVYFQSAAGLLGSRTFSAASRTSPRAVDVAAIAREEGTLSLLGGRNLAEATGGSMTASNDLAAGLERMARESSAYYLIGYQPEEAPDGRWHDLEVKVLRDGLTVRARRTYRASRPGDRADERQVQAPELDADQAPKRAIAADLLTGSVRAGLPLRLGAYVGRPAGEEAMVQFVVEIDNARVSVNRQRTPWRALLDLTVMAARVDDSPIVPVDERLDVSVRPDDVSNGWWMISREAPLPPGEWQIRAWVKDLGSGETGLVTRRLSVPDARHMYVATPMLSDRTTPARQEGAPARVVPSALREFGTRGDIVCQYEVFNFGGRGIEGLPKLTAGYTLYRQGEARPTVAPPTPIERAGSRAVRRIVLPLQMLEDGHYTIAVVVRDELTRRTLVARESFIVDRAGSSPTPES